MSRTIPPGDSPIIFAVDSPITQITDGMVFMTIAGQRYVMTRHNALRMVETLRRTIYKEMSAIVPFPAPKRKPRKAVQP